MSDLAHDLSAVDEDSTIIHLNHPMGVVCEPDAHPGLLALQFDSRRPSEMSDSTTYSMASSGRLTDMPTLEDFTTPEVGFAPDCDWSATPSSQKNGVSPMESPGQSSSQMDVLRRGSRSRASPASHSAIRTSPYTLESNRNQRWSTGGYSTTSPTPSGRTAQTFNRYSTYFGQSPLNPHNALSSISSQDGVTTFAAPGQSLAYSQRLQQLPPGQAALFLAAAAAAGTSSPYGDDPMSHQLQSQLQHTVLPSNTGVHEFGGHFAEHSKPPDLYASLTDPPLDPPESDMHPEDPDMTPHEQELRFPGDLYTPRWVRGHGNKREGWCGLCKPGRWLVLKNSAFWYDKSFTHGVSWATGTAFQKPEFVRQAEGNVDAWEGICMSCGDWVSLMSNKKKGTTWFRHAYKVWHPDMGCMAAYDAVSPPPERKGRTQATTRHLRQHSAPVVDEQADGRRESKPADDPG
jgi:hypothetical protein